MHVKTEVAVRLHHYMVKYSHCENTESANITNYHQQGCG